MQTVRVRIPPPPPILQQPDRSERYAGYMRNTPKLTNVDELIERYDAFGFDSYGVLVDGKDPLPGSIKLLERLNRLGKPFVVATNDASRLPATRLERMRGQGFDIGPDNLVTSGNLLTAWAKARGMAESRVVATGHGEAVQYVRRAGLAPVGLDAISGDEAGIVIAGIQGYDWELALSTIVTLIYRRLDAGAVFRGVVPNPDVLYPDGVDQYAIGPGGLAGLIEAAVKRGFETSGTQWSFDRLGKPFSPMFDEIKRRLPDGAEVAFFGDQLRTDIAGANGAGLASILTGTGITRWSNADDFANIDATLVPQWLLPTLDS